jgi:ribonuclease-3
LQETLQAEKLRAPVYTVVKTEGPPHDPTFFVEANWDTGKVEAKGSSIKSAEMTAANLALEQLKKPVRAKRKTKNQRI